MLLTLILFNTSRAQTTPTVEFDHGLFYIGNFSTLQPLQSDMIPGVTTVRVLSTEAWQLELTLEGPIRRTLDGLELPMSRVTSVHPQIPNDIVNLQPHIYTQRAGSDQPHEIEADWIRLATGLQAYLEHGDPPGTYEMTLLARLLDLQGAPLTGFSTCTMQFDIEPWVGFSTSVMPDCDVSILDGGSSGSSDLMVVTVYSNASWQLMAYGSMDLIRLDGEAVIPLSALSICVDNTSSGWRPERSECESVQAQPVVLGAGDAPAPFSVTAMEIPFYLSFEGATPLAAGSYGTDLMLTATVVGTLP